MFEDGRWQELRAALDAQVAVLGAGHLDTIRTRSILGLVLRDTGRSAAAV